MGGKKASLSLSSLEKVSGQGIYNPAKDVDDRDDGRWNFLRKYLTASNYFYKNAPAKMFNMGLNMPQDFPK